VAAEQARSGAAAPAKAVEESAETEPPPRRVLELELAEESGDWSAAGPLEPILAAVATVVAAEPGLGSDLPRAASACVAFADDATVRGLNARYRHKDTPTNVLSFPAPEQPVGAPTGEPEFLGDIVLAAETVVSEANERGISVADHVRHLVLHGVLHLIGFDHEAEAEAIEMEGLESRLLASLGVADPYRESE
jgi:probable rRNA maturation factor